MITGRTAMYGVLGHPVGHTLSPAMQNAALQAEGIDAVYVALPVVPERLSEALRGAHALGFRGLNVTVPHKQAAAAQCATLDRTAAACGAANTLRRGAIGWEGFNTDAPACLALLAEAGVPEGAEALVLGAGGAALAAVWALLGRRARVAVAARRAEAAGAVCRRLRSAFPDAPAPRPVPWADVVAEGERAAVLVNATSVGLPEHEGELPPLRPRPGQVVVDYVYADTRLAAAARAGGAAVITGEEILVRQGALAFTLWTGRPAPEAVMAAALRAAQEAS